LSIRRVKEEFLLNCLEGYTDGCDKCPRADCIEHMEGETEIVGRDEIEIRYYVPWKYYKGYDDLREVLMVIIHEWLHAVCIKCGYNPPEEIIEKLTRFSFS
jgi:hypothetical protein